MIWSIDGIEWNIPCQIERTAEMTASEISGVLMNRTYFNDVLGTYMKYTVAIAVPFGMEDVYTDIYETITTPVDAHEFVLPYNQQTIQITGRVESVSDQYVYIDRNRKYWKGFKFSVIANHPTKEMTLSEVLERGMSPMPPYINIPDGTVYAWDAASGKWIVTTYKNADEEYY